MSSKLCVVRLHYAALGGFFVLALILLSSLVLSELSRSLATAAIAYGTCIASAAKDE